MNIFKKLSLGSKFFILVLLLNQKNSIASEVDLTSMRGGRYCEIIELNILNYLSLDIYNSYGLSDCPDDLWNEIPESYFYIKNGPRIWAMNEVQELKVRENIIRDFKGINMTIVATVGFPVFAKSRKPYKPITVDRDTYFIFNKGEVIHELFTNEGKTYIMQSLSLEIKAEQTLDSAPELKDKLDLPQGWSFQSRTLDENLKIKCKDGKAEVIQDELRNTYQLIEK